MYSKLKLSVIILGLTVAGCAGDPTMSAVAGGTLAPAPAVDAAPALTLSGGPVTSARSGVLVTGRDWNCPRCYK
jgi:hypothetical protein